MHNAEKENILHNVLIFFQIEDVNLKINKEQKLGDFCLKYRTKGDGLKYRTFSTKI